MKTSLAILRRDLLRLLHNPIALVVAIGVCVVPCLYAWINIAGNWDPYQNTGDIRVAVVNEDAAVDVADMGEICVGDMLIEKLKDNDAIGWQFVDEDEAMDNVESGAYYAAIVIPEDFTKSLTGVLEGNTNKAHLKYYVNEKVNAIAPKVTDTGATTIETQIDSQFVATAGEVISEKLGTLSDKLIADAQGAVGTISDALAATRTALTSADGKLGDVSTGLENAVTGIGDAAAKLEALKGKGSTTSDNLDVVIDNFGITRQNTHAFIADISTKLGDGASSIAELSSTANYDISSLAGDIAAARSEVDAAIGALEKDLTDNEAIRIKIQSMLDIIVSYEPEDEHTKTVLIELKEQLSDELDILIQISNAEKAKIDELRALGQKLEDAADEVATLSQKINNSVQVAMNALHGAQTGVISESLLDISSALDTFVQVAQELSDALRSIDPIVSQVCSVGTELTKTLEESKTALEGTRESLDSLASNLEPIETEIAALGASQEWEVIKSLTATNPEGVKDFLTAPVQIEENRLYPVKNYASGVAPFFTSLALWVGGIAFVAVFKLEVDEDEVGRIRPWQAFFGRWGLFVLLGTLLAVVCCTGDLVLGIQCDYPLAFYLSAIVASFTFVTIIFSLSVAFKHLGKAIAFTLTILQVPGSSGMYPIEMMPPFFQAIGPWLPFTYSNNAMREAIAGFYDMNIVVDLLMLLLFVVPSLLVGVTARSYLVNINSLFDRRLRETDHLMVSEPTAIEDDRFRLASVVKAIRAPQEYREVFEDRSEKFMSAYPKLVRRGVFSLFVVPTLLFVLAMVTDAKIPMMACLVVFLVAVYAYLIVVEYFHDRIVRKRALTELTPDELETVLETTLRDELLPYASIDTILELRRRRLNKGLTGKVKRRAAEREWNRRVAKGDSSKGGDQQ